VRRHTDQRLRSEDQLFSLLDRAVAGETIVIARAGEPFLRLVPIQQAAAPKSGATFGGPLAGQIGLEDGFFDPVADDQLLGVAP